MSLPATLPIDISGWARRWLCRFPARSKIVIVTKSGNSIEEVETHVALRLAIVDLCFVDQLANPLGIRVDHFGLDEDQQLALGLIEAAVFEELPDDRDRPDSRELGNELLLVVAEDPGEDDRVPMLHRHTGLYLAGAKTWHAGGAAHRNRDRGIHFRRFRFNFGLNISISICGGPQLEDHAVLLVEDGELVVGNQRDRQLSTGQEFGLLAAGTDQPGLGQDPRVAIVGLKTRREIRRSFHLATDEALARGRVEQTFGDARSKITGAGDVGRILEAVAVLGTAANFNKLHFGKNHPLDPYREEIFHLLANRFGD